MGRAVKKIPFFKPFSILLLFILSYSFSIYWLGYDKNLGYYSIFSRAFELMVGSILSLIMKPDRNAALKIESRLGSRRLVANVRAVTGIILIGISSFGLTDKDPFPGYVGLVPTLGTALVIYAGEMSNLNMISRILATRPFVAIGLMSYSMYLWHWPLISFWNYESPGVQISLPVGCLILLLTFVLSIITYFAIELPVKRRRYSFVSAAFQFQLVPLTLVLLMAVVVVNAKTLPLSARVGEQLALELQFLDPKYCYDKRAGDPTDCIFGDLSASPPPQALLFGDSHAAMFTPFWETIADRYHFKLKSYSAGACYPLIDAEDTLPTDTLPASAPTVNPDLCANHIQYITENYDKYDLFILSGNWAWYLKYRQVTYDQKTLYFDRELESTIKFLIQHHKKVILMGDPLQFENQEILAMQRRSLIHIYNNEDPMHENSDVAKYNEEVRQISKEDSDIYYFDTTSMLIDPIKKFPYLNGFILYKDSEHINQTGSKLLSDQFLSSEGFVEVKHLLEAWNIIRDPALR